MNSALMENRPPSPAWTSVQAPLLKDSIRDMIRLQQNHHVPDELFWEIFNVRVLLNEEVDMDAFFDRRDSGRA